MHTQGHPYSGNDQVKPQYGLQTNNACNPTFAYKGTSVTKTLDLPASANPSEGQKLAIRQVGSPAICAAAEKRRKKDARFHCLFADCDKTFTAKHNLTSTAKAYSRHHSIHSSQVTTGLTTTFDHLNVNVVRHSRRRQTLNDTGSHRSTQTRRTKCIRRTLKRTYIPKT